MGIESNICQSNENPEIPLCKKLKQDVISKTKTNLSKIIQDPGSRFYCKNNKDTLCNFIESLDTILSGITFRHFEYKNAIKKLKEFKIKGGNLANYKAFFNINKRKKMLGFIERNMPNIKSDKAKEGFLNALYFESGYGAKTINYNSKGTIDYGPCMINSCHIGTNIQGVGKVTEKMLNESKTDWALNFKIANYFYGKKTKWYGVDKAKKAGIY